MLTCSSTSPPILDALVTKSATSSSISLSKSSIERGRGSGGATGVATGVPDCPEAAEVATDVCEAVAREFVPVASTEVAISSSRDVAASSL